MERSTDLERKKKRMPGCLTAVKQRGKNGQSTGNVMRMCKSWRISSEKRRIEEFRGSAAKAKKVWTGKNVILKQSEDKDAMAFHPNVPFSWQIFSVFSFSVFSFLALLALLALLVFFFLFFELFLSCF